MANFTISPNMNLVLPTPGKEPGPLYATDIDSSFTIIDGHDHTPGNGVLITPAGMNINSALQFNGNNLATVNSAEFNNLVSPLPGISPNLATVYVSGGELYYNDAAGNQVKITASGTVNATSSSISNGTASAAFVGGVLVVKSTALSAANIFVQSVIFTNPGNLTNQLTLSAPTLGSSYGLQLPLIPGSTSFMTLDTSGNMSTVSLSGQLTTSNLSPTAGILASQLANDAGLNPSGSIIMFGGAAAPSGYLICDGSSVLQATYPDLFSAIGTAYGAADGTHFNVPDLRGYFVRGVNSGSGHDPDAASRTALNPGGNTGDNVGSYQGDQNLSHTHEEQAYAGFATTDTYFSNFIQGSAAPPLGSTFYGGGGNTGSPSLFDAGAATGPNGGNQANPRNVYVNYIIKT